MLKYFSGLFLANRQRIQASDNYTGEQNHQAMWSRWINDADWLCDGAIETMHIWLAAPLLLPLLLVVTPSSLPSSSQLYHATACVPRSRVTNACVCLCVGSQSWQQTERFCIRSCLSVRQTAKCADPVANSVVAHTIITYWNRTTTKICINFKSELPRFKHRLTDVDVHAAVTLRSFGGVPHCNWLITWLYVSFCFCYFCSR